MKILIVEDMKDSRLLLETILKGKGYQVTATENGKQALEALRSGSFEMIISDIFMPEMDGYQLCIEIKKDRKLKEIPFIFYTSTYTQKKDEEFALKLGADLFLRKPVTVDVIVKAMQSLIKAPKKAGKKRIPESRISEEALYKEHTERMISKLEQKSKKLEWEKVTRKRMEKELSATQMHYTDFINSSRDIISYWKTPAGLKTDLPITKQIEMLYQSVCIDSNRMHWELNGFKSKDEILGKKYKEIIEEKTFDEIFTKFINNNYKLVDEESYEKLTNDREFYAWQMWYGAIENGELTHVWASSKDITKQKKAEQQLKKSEELYRSFFETARDGAFRTTVDGHFLECNQGLLDLFGYSSIEEILKKQVADFYADPADRSKMIQRIIENGFVAHLPLTFRKKDGSTINCLMTAAVIKNEAGEVTGFQGTVTDISKRILAEQEKETLQARLQQAQKMEAIGTMAGGIAHDFNNILSAIIGYTELSLDVVKEDSMLHNNLLEVFQAGKRARSLVKQILTFSRQSADEHQPIEISPIVKEAIKLLRASIPTTINIESDINSSSVVLADPSQIHQVLMNLSTNAKYAMGKKGILTISLEDFVINPEFAKRHPDIQPVPFLKLMVSDTGCGMSPEVLERIFDPFYTTKAKGEGTGMGLSVVHGIVKNHGGTVEVTSTVGKGSTFKVYFPVFEGKIESSPEDEKAVIPGGKGKILFIDDEKSIAEMGARMLRSFGYKVDSMTGSVAALELFKSEPDEYDLVITDMTMPNMTGDELAAEILSIRPDIPIILCTGFSATIDETTAAAKGISAYIMKPILRNTLAETVNRLFETKRSKQGKTAPKRYSKKQQPQPSDE